MKDDYTQYNVRIPKNLLALLKQYHVKVIAERQEVITLQAIIIQAIEEKIAHG